MPVNHSVTKNLSCAAWAIQLSARFLSLTCMHPLVGFKASEERLKGEQWIVVRRKVKYSREVMSFYTVHSPQSREDLGVFAS